ncbi:MAG: hypothetical protein ABI165_12510, partial [Bryobacteraceae bacterium]
QLLSGDLSVGADGTVTCIDGKNVYAFGHRFLAAGSTDLPFARADVLALLPNLQASFKISAAREWMGSITQDRSSAVSGVLGRRALLAPVSIAFWDGATGNGSNSASAPNYRFQMVNDPVLSPLLLQMAVFSAIDATERAVGAASYRVRGRIEFQGPTPAARVDNIYTGDANTAAQVSLGVAIPLAYAAQSGFDALKLKSIALSIDALERKDEFQIDRVFTAAREVAPGGNVDLTVVLMGANGREVSRSVRYPVPVGALPGPLYFTVADGNLTNLAEFAQRVAVPPRTASQVVDLLNALRDNEKAYIRVWRADTGYQVDGRDLPDPPPSAAMILSRSQTGTGSLASWRGSKLAELEISAGHALIAGSKTVEVQVRP